MQAPVFSPPSPTQVSTILPALRQRWRNPSIYRWHSKLRYAKTARTTFTRRRRISSHQYLHRPATTTADNTWVAVVDWSTVESHPKVRTKDCSICWITDWPVMTASGMSSAAKRHQSTIMPKCHIRVTSSRPASSAWRPLASAQPLRVWTSQLAITIVRA